MSIIAIQKYFVNRLLFDMVYVMRRIFMLGNVLNKLRTEFGISQTQLARDLGVSKQSVSNWENDNILPSIEMLVKISKRFGVTCDYLLEQDNRTFIDATGITKNQQAIIQKLVHEFQACNQLSQTDSK